MIKSEHSYLCVCRFFPLIAEPHDYIDNSEHIQSYGQDEGSPVASSIQKRAGHCHAHWGTKVIGRIQQTHADCALT